MPFSAAPSAPRFEHRTETGPVLGVGTPAPRLSWTVEHADAGWEQTAYEVEIDRASDRRTYLVQSRDQVLVPWPAPPLGSREVAVVRIRVAHADDWSAWGTAATVEAGLLKTSDWTARFISPVGIGVMGEPAPIVGGALHVPGPIRRARLYATAHGVYRPTINGRPVDDTVLAPGWTSYEHRLRYHVYDVTELIRPGDNTLEAVLGNGWYRGRLGYTNDRALYGHRLALLAQLEVTTTDGTPYVLATDGSWYARESEVLADDLYDGQSTDLRRRNSAAPTSRVEVVNENLSRLVAPDGPPIRPTDVPRSPSGTPRCSRTASWVPAPCARRGPPTPGSWPAARRSWSRR
jgi:alpha-L-rhamnosidase